MVTGTATADDETTPKTATATCTGGRSVLGGGYPISGVSSQTAISHLHSDRLALFSDLCITKQNY